MKEMQYCLQNGYRSRSSQLLHNHQPHCGSTKKALSQELSKSRHYGFLSLGSDKSMAGKCNMTLTEGQNHQQLQQQRHICALYYAVEG
jgi:hypothetical protein